MYFVLLSDSCKAEAMTITHTLALRAPRVLLSWDYPHSSVEMRRPLFPDGRNLRKPICLPPGIWIGKRFVTKFNHSETHIMATLKNVVRDLILAIQKTVQRISTNDKLDAGDAKLVSQIATNSARISGFVSDMIAAVGVPLGSDRSHPAAATESGASHQAAAQNVQTPLPKIAR